MTEGQATRLAISDYKQVWSSNDLDPDEISRTITRAFSYNNDETRRRNDSTKYFNVNYDHLQSSSTSSAKSGKVDASFGGSILKAMVNVGVSVSDESRETDNNQSHDQGGVKQTDALSEDDLKHRIAQQGVEIAWDGHRWIPKSFKVFKLNSIAQQLHLVIASKQLIADTESGAIICRVKASGARKTILSESSRHSSMSHDD